MSACPTGKEPLPSRHVAQYVATRITVRQRHLGRSHVLATPYRCDRCGAWHLTTHPSRTGRGHWW